MAELLSSYFNIKENTQYFWHIMLHYFKVKTHRRGFVQCTEKVL